MNFQAVKGTRDFYPDQMRIRNWICDAWRRVSLRNGFEEYDSPIFEYMDLFTAKSGPEIAEQLFGLTDRGGRQLAIRPEITPSLARMVNARINSLPRPIKWFSIPRVCRAENPQKGRLREFFQWNIDVIGEDSELADAECVFVCVDALRELGLGSEDVVVRYSSRAVLSAVLRALRIAEDKIAPVMQVLDKREKLPRDVWQKMLSETLGEQAAVATVGGFMDMQDAAETPVADMAGRLGVELTEELATAHSQLVVFRQWLGRLGIGDWCRYDPSIVRGLAYYTGVVYEPYDRKQSLRALAGGGRYDRLLEVLGGPKVSATGFGMGDVVLGILLEEKGKLPPLGGSLDYYVIDGGEGDAAAGAFEAAISLVARLRAQGATADFSYKRQAVGKQLKEANRRGARKAVIVKSADAVAVKDLATREQAEMATGELLRNRVVKATAR